MPRIVLTTLNARYAHAAFGLRYLLANLGELKESAQIVEFDINQRPIDIVDAILAQEPQIVGIGVYIWNAQQSEQVVAMLKKVRPGITIILGGPEVSYETDQQAICGMADYVITGEADLAFAELCRKLLQGSRPLMKVIPAELPEFQSATPSPGTPGEGRGEGSSQIKQNPHPNPLPEYRARGPGMRLPYELYTEKDIAHRVVYVEASRGCPFKCEFCLSSLDVPVRNVPVEVFLKAMQDLLDRGLLKFKFVDRTFNLNLNISGAILKFFLERLRPGMFLHFEMIPDRLPEALRDVIKQFPPAALQFEVGIQTFNDDVAELISRRQDNSKAEQNLRFLRHETGVHIHTDLIVGLPGEGIDSFAAGFDRLVALDPQEIQVGMLKRLRGTPIIRHDQEWGMVYSPHPPYEILQTRLIDFVAMQRMRRFARYWDLIANSGNFIRSTPLIWAEDSPFKCFMQLTDWLHEMTGQTHGIPLWNLVELMFRFLTEQRNLNPEQVGQTLWDDYQRGGRSDCPTVLRKFIPAETYREHRRKTLSALPRQARRLA